MFARRECAKAACLNWVKLKSWLGNPFLSLIACSIANEAFTSVMILQWNGMMGWDIHRHRGSCVCKFKVFMKTRQTNSYSFWEVPYEDMFYTVLRLVLLPEPSPVELLLVKSFWIVLINSNSILNHIKKIWFFDSNIMRRNWESSPITGYL